MKDYQDVCLLCQINHYVNIDLSTFKGCTEILRNYMPYSYMSLNTSSLKLFTSRSDDRPRIRHIQIVTVTTTINKILPETQTKINLIINKIINLEDDEHHLFITRIVLIIKLRGDTNKFPMSVCTHPSQTITTKTTSNKQRSLVKFYTYSKPKIL